MQLDNIVLFEMRLYTDEFLGVFTYINCENSLEDHNGMKDTANTLAGINMKLG